jgi:asparagine N-glycosylation enzyme membrane subunit Stt3
MQLGLRRNRFLSLEGVFLACFAVLAFALFYFFDSSNGLILGNDPAVHLQHTQMFLEMKYIPLGDIAWFPPLYHIVLATFMAFTGSTNIDQILVLMKSLTALFDVLLVLAVYLMGAKFF